MAQWLIQRKKIIFLRLILITFSSYFQLLIDRDFIWIVGITTIYFVVNDRIDLTKMCSCYRLSCAVSDIGHHLALVNINLAHHGTLLNYYTQSLIAK